MCVFGKRKENMKTIGSLLIALLLAVSPALGQSEGIRIAIRGTGAAQNVTTQIRIDKNHVRIEASDVPSRFGIFDSVQGRIYTIDLGTKTYQETSKAEMQQMMQQMMERTIEQIQAQNPGNLVLSQQLQQLRAAIPTGNLPELPPISYVELGRDKVGERACTQYLEDRTVICAAEPSVFGLTLEDFEGLRQLQRFEASLRVRPDDRPVPMWSGIIPLAVGTVEGKPFAGVVLKRSTSSLSDPPKFEILEIRRESFGSSVFEMPADLQKESPAFPARPGGARTPVIVVPAR